MIGILGSGFGLYGYLPASISIGMGSVLLPSRYQKAFSIREELQPFLQSIEWLDSDSDVIKTATTLIIARRPDDQFQLLDSILAQPNIKNIILEKPFSISPAQAKVMQDKILNNHKKCSVSFIFRYLPWAISLKNQLVRDPEFEQDFLKLTWRFMAHHYNNYLFNWKRDHEQGGGAIRFYGIHIIALLAEWGYDQVDKSQTFFDSEGVSFSKWNAIFKGPNLPNFEVEIDSQCNEQSFSIKKNTEKSYMHQSCDPFNNATALIKNLSIDLRCDYLKEVVLENDTQVAVWPYRFTQAINLWDMVEIAIYKKQ